MEFLRHIFGFNSESPLLFTQFYFWAFFALVYSVFAIIMEVGGKSSQSLLTNDSRNTRLHLRNIFLMAVSWFFYYKTSGLFLLILLFVTVSDWVIAQQIYRNKCTHYFSFYHIAQLLLLFYVIIRQFYFFIIINQLYLSVKKIIFQDELFFQ